MATLILTQASAGAPALTVANGTLCAVLDWALVQNGWAIEYTATNNRVYRPGSGNRRRLFVCHDSAVSGGTWAAVWRGCEDATAAGIANIVDPFPTTAQRSNTEATTLVGEGNTTAARNYYVIVGVDFVLLLVKYNPGSGFWDAAFFGDAKSAEAADTWATLCMNRGTSAPGTNSNVTSYSNSNFYVTSPQATPNVLHWCRSIDGSVKSTRGYVISPAGAAGFLGQLNNYPTARAGYANRINRGYIVPGCTGGSSTAAVTAGLLIPFRGAIPHLWAPLHSSIGGLTEADVFSDSAYHASASFMALPGSSGAWAIVETTDTFQAPSL